MSKSRGTREKDKLDASIIEPTLDEKSMEKIYIYHILFAILMMFKLFLEPVI